MEVGVMSITQEQIIQLDNIITNINDMENSEQINVFLSNEVEDVDSFILILNKIDKRKLNCLKKKSVRKREIEEQIPVNYKESDIEKIFEENTIEEITKEYSKKQLIEMFYSLFHVSPLSSYTKKQIADEIRIFFYQKERAKALLNS